MNREQVDSIVMSCVPAVALSAFAFIMLDTVITICRKYPDNNLYRYGGCAIVLVLLAGSIYFCVELFKAIRKYS